MEFKVGFIRGDSVDDNVEYRDNLPVNMYSIPSQKFGSPGYVINYYGLTSFATGEGIDRGGIWVSRSGLEGHYRVSGNSLISIDSSGNTTVLGSIPGSDQVSMDYSFNNLAIVADGKLYYYNPDAGFRQITDPEVGSPIDLVWVDGYFFLTDGENIYHSNILNEELYEPLDFSNAQFIPDSSRGLGKNDDNEVLVFGEFSTEYFINTGNENFAFQRITRKAQKIGIVGTHAKAEMSARYYILGRRVETAPSLHVISIGNEQSFSTREIDKIIAEYTESDLESITIDAYKRDNISFVKIHLPRHTLLFNEPIAQSLGIEYAWTILKSDVLGDLTYRAKNVVFDPRNGDWLIGDKRDGSVGVMSEENCTHYGQIAEWLLYTAFLKLETLSVNSLEMETIPGIAPDNDATVFISQTVNGRTYGKEYIQVYGENLDYNQRFRVRNMGYIRDWVGYKFRGASRSRMSFCNLVLDAS